MYLGKHEPTYDDRIHAEQGAEFAAHLQASARRYAANPRGTRREVRLLRCEARSASTLYWYSIQTDDTPVTVIVKVLFRPESGGTDTSDAARPRFFPALDPATKCRLESDALASIHDHFSQLNDPRFGTIRVFDVLPLQNALVMQAIEQPTLRAVFMKWMRNPSERGGAELRDAFLNAGAWLRSYHGMAAPQPVESRMTARRELVDVVARLTEYLNRQLHQPSFFERLQARFAAEAVAHLPESLPLGLSHGDYAMRNVFVDSGRRVTVCDTLASCYMPVYDDVTSFLMGFRLCWLQSTRLPSRERVRCVRDYQRAFLTGYFDRRPVPEAAIRLFEVFQMLNKWAALIAPPIWAAQRKPARLRAARATVMTWFFRRHLGEALLAEEAFNVPAGY
jgi:hypothetical protein